MCIASTALVYVFPLLSEIALLGMAALKIERATTTRLPEVTAEVNVADPVALSFLLCT
jgi:hypothetical protein